MPLSPDKSVLRQSYLGTRRAITPAAHQAWSAACSERLWGAIRQYAPPSASVAGYIALPSEVDILAALARLAGQHILALPAIDENKEALVFRRWNPGDALTAGPFGTREPLPQAPVMTPDILIVPLIAFDRGGHRLGYGRGYYDRALADLRGANPRLLAVGAAFSLQEHSGLPAGNHDERLSYIVTEKEALKCPCS